MKQFWICLLMLFAPPLAVAAPLLTCLSGGEEVCAGADSKFAPISDDEFERAYDVRKEKFIAWMKPMALFVQGLTGLPATITIGQAALSSEWGASVAFRKHKNIFKFTCWQPKTVLNGEVQIGSHKFTYKATCSGDRAAGPIGKIMTFATREESFYAYLDMVLESHSKLYKPVQDHLKHARSTVPPRPPSYRGASPMMAPFMGDNNYVASLKRAIELNKLSENEGAQCWTCLRGSMEGPK